MYSNVKPRSVATSVILSFVTCGIYLLFWIAGLINDICDLKGTKRTAGMDILLCIVTCGLYSWYLMYRIGSDIDDLRYSRGMSQSNNAILYLLLAVFGLGIVSYALAQSSVNELC